MRLSKISLGDLKVGVVSTGGNHLDLVTPVAAYAVLYLACRDAQGLVLGSRRYYVESSTIKRQ